MSFLGVGAGEALLVFVIALIVIGPNRFPEAMRSAGRWYRIARSYSSEVMKDVRAAVDDIEREVNAEAEDLKSVRELTDLSDVTEGLKDTERVAQEAARGTEEALRSGVDAVSSSPSSTTRPATDTTPRPLRPSQRATGSEAASNGPARVDTVEETAPQTLDPFKQGRRNTRAARPRPAPVAPDGEKATSATGESTEADASAEREDDRA
ncbi:MAG: twin-arginine translocase TatA/TatE family subunit [Chloroflexi bacterium]|nr:twin-arginine translocase TatA/TatE family subunit [Chloroflexota bacterium]MQC48136.1 twin-arginine translocase TatA/TatE family subunit [Chloroflexota bacterium]